MGAVLKDENSLYRLEAKLGEEPLVFARLVPVFEFGSYFLASFSASCRILGDLLQVSLLKCHLDDVAVQVPNCGN